MLLYKKRHFNKITSNPLIDNYIHRAKCLQRYFFQELFSAKSGSIKKLIARSVRQSIYFQYNYYYAK